MKEKDGETHKTPTNTGFRKGQYIYNFTIVGENEPYHVCCKIAIEA